MTQTTQTPCNPEDILNELGIDYNISGNRICMKCPIHNGDDDDKCMIFTSGETSTNNWVCWSGNCHQKYGRDLIGFIRGVLSARQNKEVSRAFVLKQFGNLTNFNAKKSALTEMFAREPKKESAPKVHKSVVVSRLKIPSVHYLNRGYSKAVLTKYDVGECLTVGKPMYLRAVVPVCDEQGMLLGCSGRTLQPECEKCGWFHYPNLACPSNKLEKYWASKWVHSTGFFKSLHLYNLHNAKPYINESGMVVLVEGPGDVWRLEEAGVHNSVAMFGSFLSEAQLELLFSLNIAKIVVMTDLDRAGSNVITQVYEKCSRMFEIIRVKPSAKDVGDMNVQQIKEEIIPLLERHICQ